MLTIAFSPVYMYQLPQGHRFPMVKYELLPEQLLREGTVSENQFFLPRPLRNEDLIFTHTQQYLDILDNLTLTPKEIRNIGFPVRPELIQRVKVIASGTYQCALNALQYGVSMNIAGGTHHSFADRGEGFCIFNDVAIACNLLIKNHGFSKILILDLDVHQGNGTAKIFENTPEVFTFSIHGEKNYPTRKEKSNLDIGLPDKTEDAYYLSVLDENLKKTIDLCEPEIVFYNAGVDILKSDKLGRLSVSREGAKKREEMVFKTMKKNNIPVIAVMGGGYSEKLTDIIDAHANTYRVAQYLYF
ncbi:MAG: histone deacetylase [Saprospiraceae bacterium]|nr:histone deacetylase [Saprospiraceae bacterium]